MSSTALFCRQALRVLSMSLPLLAGLAVLRILIGDDEAMAPFMEAHRQEHPEFKAIVRFITDWGNPLLYVIWAGILIRALRVRDTATLRLVVFYLAAQLLISLLLVRVIKIGVGRPRPDAGLWFEPFSTASGFNSLPSGHTTEVCVQAVPLGLRWRKTSVVLALGLLIAAVGLSRIYLGWHHPSDIFFGWLLGSFGGIATYAAACGFFSTRRPLPEGRT